MDISGRIPVLVESAGDVSRLRPGQYPEEEGDERVHSGWRLRSEDPVCVQQREGDGGFQPTRKSKENVSYLFIFNSVPFQHFSQPEIINIKKKSVLLNFKNVQLIFSNIISKS